LGVSSETTYRLTPSKILEQLDSNEKERRREKGEVSEAGVYGKSIY